MDSVQALREMLASWYRANREALAKSPIVVALAPDVTDPAKWDSCCKQIAEPGVWGGELEIIAIASLTTERRNIPSIKKRNGKMGRGDLVIKHVNLGGHRHLILDVAVNHEFGGDHLADVSRNGALRDAQPSRILESTARAKVDRYMAGYADLKYVLLPCVISASGRLLYIIAHRRTSNWFRRHSKDEPSEEAFKFRRGQYFWHTRAAIGQAAARAVAQRVQVAEHTLRRHRVPPYMRDDLAFPATLPSADV